MKRARCLLVATLVAEIGCSSEPIERAPLASDLCGNEVCKRTPPAGISARPTSAESDAGTADGSGTSLVLSGEVVIAETPDASRVRPLDLATLELVLDAADGGRANVSTQGQFDIEAPGEPPYWFRSRQTGGAADLIGTLVVIEEPASDLAVPVFERRVIQDVADNLLFPVLLDPEAGHALLTFTRDGLPLEGVRVAVVQGSVAYDSGTLFSDGLEATQERGSAALLNLPAVPFPGGSSELEVSVLDQSVRVEIELCEDAVTFVSLSL